MTLFLSPKKNHIYWYQHFSIWGVFGFFLAKIMVFMPRVLVLSIKFSFHSISGFPHPKRKMINNDHAFGCFSR